MERGQAGGRDHEQQPSHCITTSFPASLTSSTRYTLLHGGEHDGECSRGQAKLSWGYVNTSCNCQHEPPTCLCTSQHLLAPGSMLTPGMHAVPVITAGAAATQGGMVSPSAVTPAGVRVPTKLAQRIWAGQFADVVGGVAPGEARSARAGGTG